MPEMPEVEIIRRSLGSLLRNRTIKNIEINLSRLIKWPSTTEFSGLVIGKKIIDVRRIGKYLLLDLDNSYMIVIHLRMTGKLLYVKKEEKEQTPSLIRKLMPWRYYIIGVSIVIGVFGTGKITMTILRYRKYGKKRRRKRKL